MDIHIKIATEEIDALPGGTCKEKDALLKTADYLRDLAGVSAVQVTGGPVEVELNPQKEADDMEARMDATIAAATLPVEAPLPPVADLEVDSDGTPWDVRIHSSGKTFMATGPKVGTWKLIRGVDPALVEQVKAELLAVPAAVPIVEAPPAADASPDGPRHASADILVPEASQALPAPSRPTDRGEIIDLPSVHVDIAIDPPE